LTQIPFLTLAPQHSSIQADVMSALKSGFEKNRFVLGDALENFEKEFARFTTTAHCVGVGSGYDALAIALKACSVGAGDEVIVPAHTYVATWLAVSKTGAKIIPVEPDARTMNIDPEEVARRITTATKVILPVHLYGLPCDMNKLVDIAGQHNVMIIEDNAQAHGATYNGKVTGSFGHVNATSFYPTKNLGALGDGGALTTNDGEIMEFARRYRNYGFATKNICELRGANSRLDELQAAVLSVKLRHLELWNSERRAIAAKYLDRLAGIDDLRLPVVPDEAVPVYHLFVVRTTRRDALKDHLSNSGIGTMIHYPVPPHLQPAYSSSGFKPGDFPITEDIANTALSLPLWPGMTDAQVKFICDAINAFFA
jgi:dTDP-4-amino-4,6-dideoxygalactose transaminase